MGCCSSKARVAALEAEIDKMQKKLAESSEIAELRVTASEKQCADKLSKGMAEQAEEFSRQCKELETVNVKLEARVTALSSDIAKVQDKNLCLNTERSQLKDALECMAEIACEKTELQERLVHTRVESEQIRSQKERVEVDLEQMRCNKERIEQILDQIRADKERAEEELEEMRNKNQRTEHDLEQIRAEKACAEQFLEDALKQRSQLESQLDHDVCELELRIREAGAEVEKYEAEKQELTSAFESYRNQQNIQVKALEAKNQHLWAAKKDADANASSKLVDQRLLNRSHDSMRREIITKDLEF